MMKSSYYALQELAGVAAAKDYTTVPSKDDDISPANNDNRVPAKGDHAPLLPEGSSRAYRGRGEGFLRSIKALNEPSGRLPSLTMVGLWLLCVILLVLHIFAVLKWPTGDYGIRVLRENMDCGSHGTAFMTFIISLPLNGLATILCLPSSSFKSSKARPHPILRVIMILTTIPTHLM